MNAEGVEYLTRELRALGVEVWPTDANFLLVRAGEGIFDKLQREGVIVRPLAGFGMPDCIRISIGLPEENERLVKTSRDRGQVSPARQVARSEPGKRPEGGPSESIGEIVTARFGAAQWSTGLIGGSVASLRASAAAREVVGRRAQRSARPGAAG